MDPRILAHLGLPEDEAATLMASRDWSALAQTACFLGMVGEPQVGKVQAEGWSGMLACGVSAQDIADLVCWSRDVPPPAGEEEDFADALLSAGLLRFRALNKLRQAALAEGAWVWSTVLDEGQVSEASWRDALAKYCGLSKVAKAPSPFPKQALASLDRAWVERFDLVPMRVTKGKLICAVVSPPRPAIQARIAKACIGEPEFVLATPAHIESWKERWLAQAPKARGMASRVPARRSWVLDPRIASRPAVQLVEELVELALKARATDLHLEPVRDGGRMRLRIDGTCQEVLRLPAERYTEVVARLKVLADMDVTEKRLPQDGHIGFAHQGREQNVRIATVPARGGEKLAMRFGNSDRVTARLDELGLTPEHLEMLRTLTGRAFGMILATGPVGSGKTTTLYSCLQELDRDTGNVMSIEDPVEIDLPGVTQLNVNYAIGFDFVAGLRSLLRQDPDGILVGEIRDEETARIAVRASMTGLRVFSSMHTNDSTGAVTALRNFHLSSHLIASSLTGVIAQRLLRKLCSSCKQELPTTEADRQLMQAPDLMTAWGPSGCEACMGTGYAGRIGVFELLQVDSELREMVLQDLSERKLRAYAREQGLVTLQEDGLAKVRAGLSSVEEYRRVLNF